MSGEHRRPEAPQGPPWSLELLADLHAGVLDEATAGELHRQIEGDPEAREVLAALDATSSALADLPPTTIPDDVAARIDAALADEVRSSSQHPAESQQETAEAPPNNVIDLASRRRRRFGWLGAGLVAAAAVAGIVAMAPAMVNTSTDTEAGARPEQTRSGPPPLALHGDVTLSDEQFAEAMRSQQYASSLSDPEVLVACLQANGVSSGNPMGAREVTLDGRPAQLFILPGGGLGEFRLLTVGMNCGPGNPDTIADSTVGG